MNRTEFRTHFRSVGPVVLPVVHVRSAEQAERNVAIALDHGAAGVFLINHDFLRTELVPILRTVRSRFPEAWIGVNFLATTGFDAFPTLGDLAREGVRIDGYWADDARIDEREPADRQHDAEAIAGARIRSGWSGLYFGGTCFKKQREVAPADYGTAARTAVGFMDVVCTSGTATGQAAELDKIATFRREIGDAPLAVASGITPENARLYGRDVDCFMVATGINRLGDFYEIDPERLSRLVDLTRTSETAP